MTRDLSYAGVLSRRNDIMKASVGIDYGRYETGCIGFDYERLMAETGYDLARVRQIQKAHGVGSTPLRELPNVTALARKVTLPGKGARIFMKDEAWNDSGSFKARRASIACHRAKELGFAGVIAATSGNYGAAVASQAAKYGLKCIVVQECYDSHGIGQPEILEKARACEAYGAEVVQMSVGPELFYAFLALLEETGYFNASLYTPFGVAGVETLGAELVEDCLAANGRMPDAVVVTNAGGGNLTGTARGILKTTATKVPIVAASVNLKGLHMASDRDFNRKSFTTGHTGFGMPFMTHPDRSDVPRSAARPLRYVDRYVTVNQGEVFFITETLATLEGIERGPAGNISLAAAFVLAQKMDVDDIIVVQETEYTGAGKHHQAQLSFARSHGIDVRFGDPRQEIPGTSIVLPDRIDRIGAVDLDLDAIRRSLIKNETSGHRRITSSDFDYLVAETNADPAFVARELELLGVAKED
jgi:threonine dehydratase